MLTCYGVLCVSFGRTCLRPCPEKVELFTVVYLCISCYKWVWLKVYDGWSYQAPRDLWPLLAEYYNVVFEEQSANTNTHLTLLYALSANSCWLITIMKFIESGMEKHARSFVDSERGYRTKRLQHMMSQSWKSPLSRYEVRN